MWKKQQYERKLSSRYLNVCQDSLGYYYGPHLFYFSIVNGQLYECRKLSLEKYKLFSVKTIYPTIWKEISLLFKKYNREIKL